MKTVTGKVVSSTPVSVSRAASILSKFLSSETGASQAVNAYLRRSSSAFDELVRLHAKSDSRKHEKQKPVAAEAAAPTTSVTAVSERSEETTRSEKKKKKNSDIGTSGDGGEKKRIELKGEQSNGEANDGDLVTESDKQKKKKKKDKNEALANGHIDGYKENSDGRSSKSIRKEEVQKGEGRKEKEDHRRKRKSGDVDEKRREDPSEERLRKKKKSKV